MLRKKLMQIVETVQENATCHQKYLRILTRLFNETPFEDFYAEFIHILLTIFVQPIECNDFVLKALTFLAKFCAEIAKQVEEDDETHPLLFRTLYEILEHTDSASIELRYYTCRFVMLLLQYIKDGVALDNDLCDSISQKMLPRLSDPKMDIRMQAILSLVRLQDPQNTECPVIAAYISAMMDSNSKIRREAIKSIAPNSLTLCKIKERIFDIDKSIRSTAFKRIGDFGPTSFKITDRQLIFIQGFQESDEAVRSSFSENLVCKWLTTYKGSHLELLRALKLTSLEEDMDILSEIAENVLKLLSTTRSIDDILEELPIEDRVVPHKSLTDVLALYWRLICSILRKSSTMEERLDDILPELSDFCAFTERFIQAECQKKMDEWQWCEYQFIVYNLFLMADGFDISDEVGRRNLHKLSIATLQNHNFNGKLIGKLVEIAEKCTSDKTNFTVDMCQVISNIQDEEIENEKPLTEMEKINREFQVTKLTVHINVLIDQREEAVADHNYQRCHQIETELIETRQKLEDLTKCRNIEVMRVTKDDSKTLCWCLNVLIATLQLPKILTLTPALATCKNEFVLPLIQRPDGEIHWRVLRCLALYSLIDHNTANEYAKILCIPIATYRALPNHDLQALSESIMAVTDLMLMYGSSILCDDEAASVSTANSTKRLLYRNQDDDVSDARSSANFTLASFYEILMDLLDDEDRTIQKKAVVNVCKLILRGFQVSVPLLSRIILKWYSPAKNKHDKEIQMVLGKFLQDFMEMSGSKCQIQETVIPTLSSLVKAPRTSPLADVDIDNVLHFFASSINSSDKKIPCAKSLVTFGSVNLQPDDTRIVALDVLMKIDDNPRDLVVPCLVKFLNLLKIPKDNPDAIDELANKAESLLEEIDDKNRRKTLQKFVHKTKGISMTMTTTSNADLTAGSSSVVSGDARSIGVVSRRNTLESNCKATSDKENGRMNGEKRSSHNQIEIRNPKRRNDTLRLSELTHPQAESTKNNVTGGGSDTSRTSDATTALKRQVKRRKGKKSRKDMQPVVVLERFDASQFDQTVMHTIIESSMEMMGLEDDMTIETPSTITPKESPRRNFVISETSDTDNESVKTRRSLRLRKKRII